MGEGGASISTLITALVNAFQTMATNVFDGLGQVLPVVLPILAALIVIAIIIRVVQRVTGRRA